MATIKTKSRIARVAFVDSRKGHYPKHVVDVRITGMETHERALVFNLGELGELERALTLAMAAHATVGDSADSSRGRCTLGMLDRIHAAIAATPELPTVATDSSAEPPEPKLTCHACRHQQPRDAKRETQTCAKCGSEEVWI